MKGLPVDGDNADLLYTNRWKNLFVESIKRMWCIFNQTGIFIAIYQYGIVQVMCNMIKSDELYVITYVVM